MKKPPLYLALLIPFILISCSNNDDNSNQEFEATVSITITENAINETNENAEFVIELDKINDSGENITVEYTVSGTALSDIDYTSFSGETIINRNTNSSAISINTIDDDIVEENETIIITLNSNQSTGISIGTSSSATLTILDNETGIDDTLCPNDNTISTINVGCDTDPSINSQYIESIENTTRVINTNTYPNHRYTTRQPLEEFIRTFTIDATPVKTNVITPLTNDIGRPLRYFGVALNGVLFAPAPAEPFIFENTQTGEYNWDWVFEATNNQGSEMGRVFLDCASAHVGPQGYHYHGNMFEYIETIRTGLSTGVAIPDQPVQIGWASDGFPILYSYGPDASGELKKLQSSYQLKAGNRPGDGITAPCGSYNGKYTKDYEYISGLGDLDACNGIEREITLTTAQGEETFNYFYVVTETFPQVSRCLVGLPDDSFDN